MARRLASRLSVLAIIGTALGASFLAGCGGGTGQELSSDDTGISGDVGDTANDSLDSTPAETSDDTGIDDTGTPDTGTPDTGTTDTGTSDGDGSGGCTVASCGLDSDCDGIPDSIEGRATSVDTDKDGIPDYLDLDSDGDGIPDKLEWREASCDPTSDLNDADGDGVPNFQDLDSDGNGLPDKDEVCPPAAVLTKLSMAACDPAAPYDFDGDGTPDYVDFDNDHDSSSSDKTLGLLDKVELSDNTGKYVGLTLDTDKDGIPDLYDVDSDNDFILDLDDGTTDTDGDGVAAFRDTDSDGDKVPDWCEARANKTPTIADYSKALLDTNKNGIPDYLDLDSDGDYLGDGAEDKNGDCIVDKDETDRLKGDTDGDGIGDLAEVALLGVAAAKDPAIDPIKAGKFYFIVPYSLDGSKPPSPTSENLGLSTTLKKGDVAFIVDTTGSMGEEIAALKASLATTIIPALSTKFSDLGIGVAAHDDYPTTSTGARPNALPFYLPATGTISTDSTRAVTAVGTLTACESFSTTRPGCTAGDGPESQVHAMMRAVTGNALAWTGTYAGSLAADVAPAGFIGTLRFRDGALPIIIPITDAAFHNGKRALNLAPTGAAGDYSAAVENAYAADVTSTSTIDNLVTSLNTIGAKVIGVASSDIAQDTSSSAAYGYLAYLADKTGSYVPKSAFGKVPAACMTGLDAGSATPDGPVVAGAQQCRLVFALHTNGSGLGQTVVDGVSALLNAITYDVYVKAFKDPADTGPVDPVDAFMTSIDPQPAGGTDPVTKLSCVTFDPSKLSDKYHSPKALAGAGDIKETILALNPGKLFCFKVTPKANTTVTPKTTPQTFKAFLSVLGDKPGGGGSISLGADREVLFIVPPTLN